jgi:hypothetical protein
MKVENAKALKKVFSNALRVIASDKSIRIDEEKCDALLDQTRSEIKELAKTFVNGELYEDMPVKQIMEMAEDLLEKTEGTTEHLNSQFKDAIEIVCKKHPFDNSERAEAIREVEEKFTKIWRDKRA